MVRRFLAQRDAQDSEGLRNFAPGLIGRSKKGNFQILHWRRDAKMRRRDVEFASEASGHERIGARESQPFNRGPMSDRLVASAGDGVRGRDEAIWQRPKAVRGKAGKLDAEFDRGLTGKKRAFESKLI